MAVKFLLCALAASFSTITAAASLDGMTLVPRQSFTVDTSFGYNDDRGPVNWGNLDPQKNEQCYRGREQSPININPGSSSVTTVPAGSRPRFNYPPIDSATFGNTGDTIKAFVSGSIEFDGATWNLQQFHVHVPSEHRLSQEHYPMEAHFVHARARKSSVANKLNRTKTTGGDHQTDPWPL